MEFEEGKVYLRDVRSGQIYLYERTLADNRNFEACVPNPVPEKEAVKAPIVGKGEAKGLGGAQNG